MARKPRVMRCLCVIRWCSSTGAISSDFAASCETRVMLQSSSRTGVRAAEFASAHSRIGLRASRRRGAAYATVDSRRRGRVCAFAAHAWVS